MAAQTQTYQKTVVNPTRVHDYLYGGYLNIIV